MTAGAFRAALIRARPATKGVLRGVLTGALGIAIAVAPMHVAAANSLGRAVEGPAPARVAAGETDSSTDSTDSTDAAGTVDDALAQGDLNSARERAVAEREAKPSAESWKREAEVCEQLGDYECAIAAWRGHLAALPEDAHTERGNTELQIESLEEQSRGVVADEPESTHRARLDQERADRIAAANPPPPKPKPKPKQETLADVKIHKKWYFWVTIVAFAASAAAITGIAVQAALEEQADDLDTANAGGRGSFGAGGSPGLGFRF